MKIRADEHVSVSIVRLVREMALSPEWELSSVKEEKLDGTADAHWLTDFCKNGGEAIISADKDFHTKHHQIMAIQNTGAKVIYLPPKWQNASCNLQAAHILMWWPRIEKKLKECKKREFWEAPWNVSLEGELVKKGINFHESVKKIKKQNRPARQAVG
ncbi:MAG TPA: hypothetical protein DEA55_03425 [Rhodospirillaceae bacterium]|nr:hypothetical protein [Rhodospirillaceae bacterium]